MRKIKRVRSTLNLLVPKNLAGLCGKRSCGTQRGVSLIKKILVTRVLAQREQRTNNKFKRYKENNTRAINGFYLPRVVTGKQRIIMDLFFSLYNRLAKLINVAKTTWNKNKARLSRLKNESICARLVYRFLYLRFFLSFFLSASLHFFLPLFPPFSSLENILSRKFSFDSVYRKH